MIFYVLLLNSVNIGKDDNVAKCHAKMSGAVQACRHLILLVILNYPESGVTDFVDLSNLKRWNNGLCELQALLCLLLLLLAGFCQHFLKCYSLFLLLNFFTDQLLYFVLCW